MGPLGEHQRRIVLAYRQRGDDPRLHDKWYADLLHPVGGKVATVSGESIAEVNIKADAWIEGNLPGWTL